MLPIFGFTPSNHRIADPCLPDSFVPQNQDGEVAEFLCRSPATLIEARAAGELTHDAGRVSADFILRCAAET